MKSIEKLSIGLQIFEEIVMKISEDCEATRNRGSSCKIANGDELEIEEMLRDFEETVLNSRSFLEYKANYCK